MSKGIGALLQEITIEYNRVVAENVMLKGKLADQIQDAPTVATGPSEAYKEAQKALLDYGYDMTPEEMSMELWGTPDYFEKYLKSFKKMILPKMYNPSKVPWNKRTWAMHLFIGDTRQYKTVEIDGQVYRPVMKSQGPDRYFIRKGIKDVGTSDRLWLQYIEAAGRNLTEAEKDAYERAYTGTYRKAGAPTVGRRRG